MINLFTDFKRKKPALIRALILICALAAALAASRIEAYAGGDEELDMVPFFLSYRYSYGAADGLEAVSGVPASGAPEAGDNVNTAESDAGNHAGFLPAVNPSGNSVFELSPELKGNVSEIYLELYLMGNGVFYEMGRDFFTDYLDRDGNLFSKFDGIWYTLNGYTCPYFVTELWVDGENRIVKKGVIPVLLNGRTAELTVYDKDYSPVVTGVRLYGSEEVIPLESLLPSDTVILVTGYSTKEAEWTADYQVSPPVCPAEGLELKYDYLSNPSNAVAFYMITDTAGNTHSTDALK